MITIPTSQLIGAVSDVLPFAAIDLNDPTNCVVRIEWDGHRLITMATDRLRTARCTWDPAAEDLDESTADYIDEYGADSTVLPWSLRISTDDAKSLCKAFKLRGAKRQGVPVRLAVTCSSAVENTYTLRASREGAAGWSPLALDISGHGKPRPEDNPEADLHATLAKYAGITALGADVVAFPPKMLAAFGKVRAHGPLELEFTGPGRAMVRWRMGSRFVGLLTPTVPAAEATTPGRTS